MALVAAAFATMVSVSGVAAQRVNLDTLSLVELPGVMVVIEGAGGAEHNGLFVDSLHRDITTALRDAGVTIYNEDAWQVTIGNPMLLVSLDLVHPSDFFYLFNIEVELQQLVVLARDSTIPAYSATWAAADITGSVSSERLPTIRDHVLRQVDQFISALAIANRRYRGRRFVQRERSGSGDGNAVESSSNNVSGSTETDP
jgi:hypothetical protein